MPRGFGGVPRKDSTGAGVFDAGPRPRHGLQPVGLDRPAAHLADAVRALVDLAEGGVEVSDLGLELLEERIVLLPLESLGADVALVLILRGEFRDVLRLGLGADALRLRP